MKVQDLEKQLKNFFPFGDTRRFSEILFRTINISGSNTVDFDELLIAFSILTKGSNFERLRWIFRFYDNDSDGVVSKTEMMNTTKALVDMVGSTLETEADAKAMVDRVFCDVENESGFLTFDDFKTIARKKSEALNIVTIFMDDQAPRE